MVKSNILWVILAICILLVFHAWLAGGVVSSGDLGYISNAMYRFSHIQLFAWEFGQGNGFGGFAAPVLPVYIAMNVPEFFLGRLLGLSWGAIAKISYLFPYLFLGSYSIYFLAKGFISKITIPIAILLFIVNTYILLIISGGQVLIALSYAIAPLIIGLWAKNLGFAVKTSILAGLLFGLQMSIDVRIWAITLAAILLYGSFQFVICRDIFQTIRYLIFTGVACVITAIVNGYWILPTIVVHQDPFAKLGSAYNTTQSVIFLSFAKFENSFGLLHPNWPENIFGFIHFMRPEFLALPILAFASLLFVKGKNRENIYVVFFALLSLIGSFLAKGANDPFGNIYLWLFTHVPGFVMFRDATKWYVLVAISYSMLVPYTIGKISERLQQNKIVQWLFIVCCAGYLLFLIRPALLKGIDGTLQVHQIPQEYTTFATYLDKQPEFSRVLWIPTSQRYGYYSPTHPSVKGEDYFQIFNTDGVIKILKDTSAETMIEASAIKYVVVPFDSQKEIFVSNGRYDNAIYVKTIQQLQHIPWLHQISGFGKIAVFMMPHPKDHFWSPDTGMRISYDVENPTQYRVHVVNAKKGDRLVFAESYDSHWEASSNGQSLLSQPYNKLYNSFILPKDGTYTFTIFYTPQKWVDIGLWISVCSLTVVICTLLYAFRRNSVKYLKVH